MAPITSVFTGQFILICWAIFLVFWFVTSFSAKPTINARGGLGNGLLIRLGIALVVILVLGQQFSLLSVQLWPYSTTVGIIADILAAAGLLLMLWSRVVLGGNWSVGVVLKEGHELIQRGPYAVIRHPIYTGLLLLFLGETVWYGDVAWFLVFIAVCITFYSKARMEETFLMRHFPQSYPLYKSKTKALIPFIL